VRDHAAGDRLVRLGDPADTCICVDEGEVEPLKFGTRFAVPRRAGALVRGADVSFRATLDDGRRVCARAIVVATGVR
jgi:hypothetical protein